VIGAVAVAVADAPRIVMFGDGFEESTILRTGPDGLKRVITRRSWAERESVLVQLLRRTAVRVPSQSGPDWLFEVIQAAVVRPPGMAKAELGIGEIVDRIARGHGEG
jgi:hypothetical protein